MAESTSRDGRKGPLGADVMLFAPGIDDVIRWCGCARKVRGRSPAPRRNRARRAETGSGMGKVCGMGRPEIWRTAAGSSVWIEADRRGEWIKCEGCFRPILVTGAGPARFAAQQHARQCRN